MIKYQNWFIVIGETFFNSCLPSDGVDLQIWNQLSAPLDNTSTEEFLTLEINLQQDPAALLALMSKDVRYELRRAERGNDLTFQVMSGQADLAAFANFYDEFAKEKSIPRIDRNRLNAMATARLLDLTMIGTSDGSPLAWHAHYVADARARLLFSASLRVGADAHRRALIGRANRFHHWLDLTRFRNDGFKIYDFGGWYSGSADADRVRINQFKAGFGGRLVTQFSCTRVMSVSGKTAVLMKRALSTGRRMQAALRVQVRQGLD